MPMLCQNKGCVTFFARKTTVIKGKWPGKVIGVKVDGAGYEDT
jgi:hypothetical protein